MDRDLLMLLPEESAARNDIIKDVLMALADGNVPSIKPFPGLSSPHQTSRVFFSTKCKKIEDLLSGIKKGSRAAYVKCCLRFALGYEALLGYYTSDASAMMISGEEKEADKKPADDIKAEVMDKKKEADVKEHRASDSPSPLQKTISKDLPLEEETDGELTALTESELESLMLGIC